MEGKLVFFKDEFGTNNFGHVQSEKRYESGMVYTINVITDGGGTEVKFATLISNGPWVIGQTKILGYFNISDGALIYQRFTEGAGHIPVVTFNTQANVYKSIPPTPDSTSQTTSGASPQAGKQLTAEATSLKDLQESLDEAVATISTLNSDLVSIKSENETLVKKNDAWMNSHVRMKAKYEDDIKKLEDELTACEAKLEVAPSQNAGGKRKKRQSNKRKTKRKKRSKRH